jgi:hypothetical protein
VLWRLFQRGLIPLAFGICAVAALVYGVKYNTVAVYIEQEVLPEPILIFNDLMTGLPTVVDPVTGEFVIVNEEGKPVPIDPMTNLPPGYTPPPMPGDPMGGDPYGDPMGGDPFGDPMGGDPFGNPMGMGQANMSSGVTETPVLNTIEVDPVFELVTTGEPEPESKIVSDVTIGGLELLASGIIRRTYSGEPPLLCPT